MIQYILIFCTVGVSKCDLTQTERDKTLCYHNTLRQVTSNCISRMGRKLNILTWNKTLEHFAHIYSRPTHLDYATILELSDFCEKTNLMQISYEVDQHEEIYELLSNATEYFGKDSPFGLASLFHRLSATNKATQMGCDYGYNNRTVVPTIFVQCFYDYPLDEWFVQPSPIELKCLYRDDSLSFSRCSVDSPSNKSPDLNRISFKKLHLVCLVLLKINFYR